MKYNYMFLLLFSVLLCTESEAFELSNKRSVNQHGSGEEIKNLRNRTTKHFDNGNGTYSAKMYTGSIHYLQNNEWLDIDLTIQKGGGNEAFSFFNTTNSFRSYYPANLSQATVVTKGEFTLSEKIVGLSYTNATNQVLGTIDLNLNHDAIVSNNTITYPDIINHVDVRYTQLSDSRKFEVIISDKKGLTVFPVGAKYISLTEELVLPQGAVIVENNGGLDIVFNGKVVANFPIAVAYDASNTGSELAGKYTYSKDGNTFLLTTSFEIDWLNKADRVFPISLDPTVVMDPFNVTYATGYMTTGTGTKSSGFLRIAAADTYSWAKFDLTSLVAAGATSIVSAEYSGYHYTTTGADKFVTIVGMQNIDPVTDASTAVSAQINSGPVYNGSYIFGGASYMFRVGVLGANAYGDILSRVSTGWIALGFGFQSGNATFMYQRGYDAPTASEKPYFEIDYLAGAPVPPIASYAYNDADTIWLNNPKTLVNTSNGATRSYWDILGFNSNNKLGPFLSVSATRQCKNTEGINDCFIDTTNQTNNFKWTFAQAGYYRVKVTALNKYGNDTYIDTIFVDTPATKPHSEFFVDKRVIGVNDFASCFDLSSNGPTQWYWYLKSSNPNPNPLNPNRFTPYNYSQNPNLNAFDGGMFDMCLVTTNARGSDTLCKKDYIRIIPGYPVCAGQSADKDTVARDQEGSAILSTVGGTYLPTLIGTCGKGFTVSTCSDTVVMYLERFKMRNLVTASASDSLIIHKGTLTGPVIARFGGLGTSIPEALKTVKVPGGIAYLETKLVNTTGLIGDSGYTVRWYSIPPTYTKPHAAFSVPDTIYDKYTVQYVNQSTGVQMKYAWDTNGDGVYGLDNPSSSIDSTSTNPTRSFNVFAPYKAKICLKTYNCVGADTACKQVQFLPISTSPVADFTVNRTTGFTTDTFRFTDLTQNGAISWNWTFVPNNVAYLNGTNAGSQHPVLLLNSAIAYDVTLTATNQLGSNSVTKLSYATAIAFNSPGCSSCPDNAVPSNIDVGISQVSLADMDTSTALNTPIYHALYNIKTATLYRGVTYTLSTARTTNNDGMSTRAWIDFNHNTNFGDEAIEVVISENNQHKAVTTGTFKVPDNAPLGNTRMRVGVTLGSTTITQSVTTLGCYEDYGILIAIDREKPILTLRGSAITKVEVNKTYTDSGVTATDNLEGDISSRYQVIGTVDMTKVGYYTLKYIVADLYGNVSDTAYRTVQVEINQTGPSITLIGDDSVYVDVYTGYTEQGATALSNDGINFTSLIVKTGKVDTAVLGTYVLNYSVTDQFNFTATAKRWVFVQDTMIPTISSLAGTSTFNHQVNLPYMDPIVVSDNYWKNITPVRTGTINPNVPGKGYNLQYNAVDGSGNIAATYYVTVVVKDLVPPTVKLLGADPLIVDVFSTFIDPGVSDSDNYYANVTMIRTGLPDMNTLGTYTVTYTVTDGAGNSTAVTRTVIVVDRFAPEIELLGKNPVTHHRFTPYVDPGVKLKDNYYSDAALRGSLIIDESELDVTIPGLYFVNYTVTDPSGNSAQKRQRLVEVVDYTGLSDVQGKINISVFPNPGNGLFTISTQSKVNSLKVVDILGQTVYEKSVHETNTQIDLTSLKKGLYFIQFEMENGDSGAHKIIIQ